MHVLFIVGEAVAVAMGDGVVDTAVWVVTFVDDVVVVMVIVGLVVLEVIDSINVATEFVVVADAFRLAVVEGVDIVTGEFDSTAEIGMII